MSTAPLPQPSDGHAQPDSGRNVLDVLRDIKAGLLDPKTLADDDRRQCVIHLTEERLSVSEIAQVLKVATRTIWRDRRKIQEEQAIKPDPQMTSMLAGKFAQETDALRAHVHRILRDKDASHADRIEAARVSHEMLDKCLARLQSMGFLPTAPQRTQAEVTHLSGDAATLDELLREQQRLQEIVASIATNQQSKPESAAASERPSSPEGGAR